METGQVHWDMAGGYLHGVQSLRRTLSLRSLTATGPATALTVPWRYVCVLRRVLVSAYTMAAELRMDSFAAEPNTLVHPVALATSTIRTVSRVVRMTVRAVCLSCVVVSSVLEGVGRVLGVGAVGEVLGPVVVAVAVQVTNYLARWPNAMKRIGHHPASLDRLTSNDELPIRRADIARTYTAFPVAAHAFPVDKYLVDAAYAAVTRCLVSGPAWSWTPDLSVGIFHALSLQARCTPWPGP